MAQIREVRLVDDIDQSEAVETITFSLRNKKFEIDLSADHIKALEESFAEFAEHARPVSARQDSAQPIQRRGQRSSTGGTAADKRAQANAVREWARQNGRIVSDRGRISQAIQRAFDEAHGSAA